MVDIFENKMCNYCRNSECDKNIVIINSEGVTTYKCSKYIKDESKIIPYAAPPIITAKRKYIDYYER